MVDFKDFELMLYPHRYSRELPLEERLAVAVEWTRKEVRKEKPMPRTVAEKLRRGENLTDADRAIAIDALIQLQKKSDKKSSSYRPSKGGKDKTEPGRDFFIHQLIERIKFEFNLTITSNEEGPHHSAIDVLSIAMNEEGLAPSSVSRLKAIYYSARPAMRAAAKNWLDEFERQHLINLSPEEFTAVVQSLGINSLDRNSAAAFERQCLSALSSEEFAAVVRSIG